jgi:hypothetical protein
MAENSDGVVVTKGMLTQAARVRDLKSLTRWARQGVRVTTAEPLVVAVQGRHLDAMRCLVQKLGADVNGGMPSNDTPLAIAAVHDYMAGVQCLVELGADVNQASVGEMPLSIAASMGNRGVVRGLVHLGARLEAVDRDGDTALLVGARNGHYATVRYLLEEAGASIDDVTNDVVTVWDFLTDHLENAADTDEEEGDEEDPAALTGLLRVMVLRGAPPPALVALLSPEPTRVVQEGARLRAWLPAYLAHRRAYLDSRCPRVTHLPGVLRALIYTFEGPTTTEELWATRLGSVP